jgi:hypothetical protein
MKARKVLHFLLSSAVSLFSLVVRPRAIRGPDCQGGAAMELEKSTKPGEVWMEERTLALSSFQPHTTRGKMLRRLSTVQFAKTPPGLNPFANNTFPKQEITTPT